MTNEGELAVNGKSGRKIPAATAVIVDACRVTMSDAYYEADAAAKAESQRMMGVIERASNLKKQLERPVRPKDLLDWVKSKLDSRVVADGAIRKTILDALSKVSRQVLTVAEAKKGLNAYTATILDQTARAELPIPAKVAGSVRRSVAEGSAALVRGVASPSQAKSE